MKILILGSSHVNRFQDFIVENNLQDFNISSLSDMIHYYGIPGGRVENKHHVQLLERAVAKYKPDGLIVQIGGNDIDRRDADETYVRCTVFRLTNICRLWQKRYSIHQVFINQFLPRNRTRHIDGDFYNILVKFANQTLKDDVHSDTPIIYWKLKGFTNPRANVLLDGVHMNNAGFQKYFRHIRGAILHCLSDKE